MSEVQPKVAMCPGSYDPVTNGHLDTIKRVSEAFDEVIVAVVNQPVRKQKTLFNAEERKAFIEDAVAGLDNVRVEVFDTLVVDFALSQGATVLVKGLRAISDFEYEFEMNQLNRKLNSNVESLFVMSSAEYSFLSSSGVKEMAAFGGNVGDLVPTNVAEALKERYAK